MQILIEIPKEKDQTVLDAFNWKFGKGTEEGVKEEAIELINLTVAEHAKVGAQKSADTAVKEAVSSLNIS